MELTPLVAHESLSSDQEYRERFRRESLAAASLISPHVVPIHDFGEVEGCLFIDMRLIDGADLAARLDGRPMSVARAVNIVLQVCDALADTQSHGVVHREVKPSNILLTDSDFAYPRRLRHRHRRHRPHRDRNHSGHLRLRHAGG